MAKGLICFILALTLACSGTLNSEESNDFEVGEVIESLISIDHTSEGILVPGKNNEVIHIFRLDPGDTGGHIGNKSYIAMRSSEDNGMTWSKNSIVYSDEFDDRNIHGGMIDDERIVIFFRRYNAESKDVVDINYILSDDFGASWSERRLVPTTCKNVGTGDIIYISEKDIYLQPFYSPTEYYSEIMYSSDGEKWELYSTIDYRGQSEIRLDEIAIAYLGNGQLVALARDYLGFEFNTYYQLTSSDFGLTWSIPQKCNIAYPHFTPSPTLVVNNKLGQVFAFVNDRKGNYTGDHSEEKLYIFSVSFDEVMNGVNNWVEEFDKVRPINNPGHVFYGYFTVIELSNGDYLAIFTDSTKRDNGGENAHFYQFTVEFDKTLDLMKLIK